MVVVMICVAFIVYFVLKHISDSHESEEREKEIQAKHEEEMERIKQEQIIAQEREKEIKAKHEEEMERIKDEHIRTQERVKDNATKFCSYCGSSIPFRSCFCPNCGGNVADDNGYVTPDNYGTSAYSYEEKDEGKGGEDHNGDSEDTAASVKNFMNDVVTSFRKNIKK